MSHAITDINFVLFALKNGMGRNNALLKSTRIFFYGKKTKLSNSVPIANSGLKRTVGATISHARPGCKIVSVYCFITFLFLYWVIPLFIVSMAYTVKTVDNDYDLTCLLCPFAFVIPFVYSCAYEMFFSTLISLTVIPILIYPPLMGKIINYVWDSLEDYEGGF